MVHTRRIWYSAGLPAVALRWVLIRDPREQFETQALLCTDLDAVRQRLGFETQRQWSELAILRAAPALMGLFSLVTLFADRRMAKSAQAVRRVAWYDKPYPTFSDALAQVRKQLWAQERTTFRGSPRKADMVKVPRAFAERLTDAVCYAA